MSKSRIALATLLLAAAAAGPALAAPTAEGFFKDRTYYGGEPCLAIAGPAPRDDEALLVFSPSRWPALVPVAQVKPAAKLVYIGMPCQVLAKGPDAPAVLATISRPGWRGEGFEPLIALRNVPSAVQAVGGAPRRLELGQDGGAIAALVRRHRLPFPRGTLATLRRFDPPPGRATPTGPTVTVLHLGEPVAGPTRGAFAAVRIRTYTFVGERLVATERRTRTAGDQERVDQEPVVLTPTAWAESSVETLGFLGLERGKRWYRLTFDGAPEGLIYRIAPLDRPDAPAYEAYHYMPQ